MHHPNYIRDVIRVLNIISTAEVEMKQGKQCLPRGVFQRVQHANLVTMIGKCFLWVGKISKGDYRKNEFRSKKEMFISSPVLEIHSLLFPLICV